MCIRDRDHVDNKTGNEIAERFATIYEDLYNSVEDEGLDDLKKKLDNVGIFSSDIDGITPAIVKQAANNLKSCKTGVSGQYCSLLFI